MKPSGERSVGKADTLLQVRDTEAKASRIIEEADEKQKAILVAARREAIEKYQAAEAAIRKKIEAAISQEKASLAAQRSDSMRKGTEEAAKLMAKAKDRIPKAKTHIRNHFERTFDAATGTNE